VHIRRVTLESWKFHKNQIIFQACGWDLSYTAISCRMLVCV
jgi:hypothetical protein